MLRRMEARNMEDQITVNGRVLSIRRLLGKGKGGYSYLAADERGEYVVKQIHHEPCEYYQFGDKIAAEQRDYERLLSAGIPMPRLLDVDTENERILKEYIPGPTAAELIAENLREIYIEAYTQKEASEFIFRETAKELYQIFGPYQPELTARDFYDMEIGSASIMRGYMAHPCDEELTLEKKLRLFLTMSLRAYNVPKEETEQAIRFVEGLDIRTISEQVMQALFRALAMRFEFSLAGITLPAQK